MNRWRVAGLLLGSGFAALVMQTAWLRELRLIFGVSTSASAAVLAIFMGGLGLGGVLLGRRADRAANPLDLYARLEIGVAATAALTPFLVVGVRAVYVGVGGTAALGDSVGTAARLLLALIVLGLPTFLMGGTLPAAARSVETATDLSRRHLALLYGANTVGAVVGVLTSTFFLLELLGNRRTLWLACLLNALVAITARSLARRGVEGVEPGEPPAESSGPPPVPAVVPAAWVLAAACAVGFAFFLMELVWYRMLAPLLGGSTFTFGLILAIALAGIGAGGIAYATLFGNRRVTAGDFAWTAALEAAFVALPLALGDRLAILALLLRELGAVGFGGHVAAWTALTLIVVFPAAFVAGLQFPLLVALLGSGRRDVGRQLGLAYLWNTAGAIGGALAGGFGLMAWLSAPTTWRLAAGLLAVLAVAAAAIELRRARARRSLAALAGAALAAALLLAEGPTAAWRHSGIGAGRFPEYQPTRNGLRAWTQSLRRSTIWEADGIESSVAMNAAAGIAFLVNGKSDGHVRHDAGTQVMAGLLGALLHPRPQRALVIGLGTGSSAGWLGAVDDVERVDVVELEPVIVEVARASAAVNRNVLENPRVRLLFGDAREWMLTTREQYDLVFSEPSNPYRAGIASLFTTEFYRSAQRRLRPGGLFLQWLQAYEVDDETVEIVYSTLGSVFPVVETWRTTKGDLLLVASDGPLDWDADRLRRRIAAEPFYSALSKVWLTGDLEGLLARYVADSELMRRLRDARRVRLNTDDRPPIEFGFARTLGRRALGTLGRLSATAEALGANRPPVAAAAVDWSAVAERSAGVAAVDGFRQPSNLSLGDEAGWRSEAVAAWSRGELARTLAAWSRQSGGPTDDVQRLALAEAAAEAGGEPTEALLAPLRERLPIEAAVIEARRLWRSERWSESAAALASALTAYRGDPWPNPAVMERALELARALSRDAGETGLTLRLADALSAPFAVRMHDELRRRTLFELAGRLPGAPCNEPMRLTLAQFEPHVPWSRQLLATRALCYAAWGHPRRERARRELEEYLAAEPPALDLAGRPVATSTAEDETNHPPEGPRR